MNISPFSIKKILLVRPKIFENEKREKKNLKLTQGWSHSDAVLQVLQGTEPNHRSSSPLFNSLQFSPNILLVKVKHQKKREKKWRFLCSTHVHEPLSNEFIRGSGRSLRRKLRNLGCAIVEENCCRFPVSGAETIDSSGAAEPSGFSKSRARERATTSEGRRRLAGNRRPPRRISSL